MTPLQFARAECSNFEHDGSCKGLLIANDGRITRMKDVPAKCVLSSPKVRCPFFEECVLPLAKRIDTSRADQLTRRKEYEEAEHQYRISTGIMKAATRACPKCGRQLEHRARLCYVCREEAAKASNAQRAKAASPVQS